MCRVLCVEPAHTVGETHYEAARGPAGESQAYSSVPQAKAQGVFLRGRSVLHCRL